MFNLDRDQDTICSVATASGLGGISVIRISGNQSVGLIKKLCKFLPSKMESHQVYYGFLHDENHNKVDEVLVTFFEHGRSFTFEDTVEVSYHGSPIISSQILKLLTFFGARMSQRGEFTYRAFINGRIDLSQAESVLSLIESQSQNASRLSLRQLEGNLSKVYLNLEDKLTDVLANLEANIDYAAEDIIIMSGSKLISQLQDIISRVKILLDTYKTGSIISDGFQVALVGQPNVGKSSLMNCFVSKDKSIVTPISGTTRDIVDESIMLNGFKFHFVDTAGICSTDNVVEQIGVNRALDKAKTVNIVTFILDHNFDFSIFDHFNFSDFKSTDFLVLFNKVDLCLLNDSGKLEMENKVKEIFSLNNISSNSLSYYWISALEEKNLQNIFAYFESKSHINFTENSATLMQLRHFELLSATNIYLEKGLSLIKSDSSPEFIALELQTALVQIKEILGKEFNDDVMDRVFSNFCLGK